jgi:hypothetical protein
VKALKNIMKKVAIVAVLTIMAIGTVTIMGGGGAPLPESGIYLIK